MTPFTSKEILILSFGMLLGSCVPASYMPPPESYLFQGKETGLVVFGTTPPTTAFGMQWWMMKQKGPNSLYGLKLHNINTEIISLIGGGVFLRYVAQNTSSKYIGWEAELGTGYARGAFLTACRRNNLQLYAAPGLQLQVDSLLLLTAPIGLSIKTNHSVSIASELSSVIYVQDWLNGYFYYRLHPSVGISFDW